MTATDHVATSDHAEHVSDWVYIKIAILLGVLTGIEVFTYFESVHSMSDTMLIVILVTLMIVKFGLVAAYFMHLKYDNAIFTKFLAAGLIIAWPVYAAASFASDWLSGWNWVPKVIALLLPSIILSIWLVFAWKGGDLDDNPPDPAPH